MDIEKLCDAFKDGLVDGNSNKDKVEQENFNLTDAYNYGYKLKLSNIKSE